MPVVGCSFVLAVIELGLSRLGLSGIPKAAYHTFVVLALSEELCKCFMFHRLLAKYQRAWSWADYVILIVFFIRHKNDEQFRAPMLQEAGIA